MRDVLAIVGSHPRTREKFDFSRTDADVWLFNEAANNDWAKRVDAVFQLHVPVIWQNPKNRNDPHHYKWLQSTLTTVYMQEHYEDVPQSVPYPLDAIKAMAGEPNFLTSSVAMAVALGIHQGYKRIEIYGVAMETDTEYRYQRDGVSFWMGYARGNGIEVMFADNTFDAPIYGFEGEVALDYQEIAARVAELEAGHEAKKQDYIAAMQTAQNAYRQFVELGGEQQAKNFVPHLQSQLVSGMELSKLDGAIQENKRYLEKADAMKEQSGAFVFSRQEFEQGLANAQKLAQKFTAENTAAGAKLDALFVTMIRTPKRKNRVKHNGEFIAAVNAYISTGLHAALYSGVMQENARYMSTLDKYIRAAGGAKSEAVMLERLNDGMVAA